MNSIRALHRVEVGAAEAVGVREVEGRRWLVTPSRGARGSRRRASHSKPAACVGIQDVVRAARVRVLLANSHCQDTSACMLALRRHRRSSSPFLLPSSVYLGCLISVRRNAGGQRLQASCSTGTTQQLLEQTGGGADAQMRSIAASHLPRRGARGQLAALSRSPETCRIV